MGHEPKWKDGAELELDWGARQPRPQSGDDAPATTGLVPLMEASGVEARAGKGMPGDPRHMSVSLRHSLDAVLTAPRLRMRQQRELLEMLIGWEGRNRYEVCDEHGRGSLFVGETGDGWGSRLMRNFWPFYRARLECMTPSGTLALALEHPWSFLFARAEVLAWDGRALGTIVQRFRLLGRRFDIVTPAGAVVATIEGPLLKPWTFQVFQRGEEVAVIRKHWSGLFQETFSDADNYSIEFHPPCTDGRLRQLVLAAAFLMDLTYFDNRKSGGSIFNVGLNLWDFWS
ncbi:scramblase [Myxococcus sp. K15C18031901]|uniref:phospholipid scramblase family protein n=1 Tax=Myxococcus dinghuensis TaxID=2906761 RepID=UPI0020A75E1F|nr:phospholipid scramblase family protein [Myxococcus dinghuensis]MCP3099322.1 scramblase [Myxococcus dinghuensis]